MGSLPSKSIVFALSAKIHEELMSKSHGGSVTLVLCVQGSSTR